MQAYYYQEVASDDTAVHGYVGSIRRVPNSTASDHPDYFVNVPVVFVANRTPSPELYSPKDPKKELQRIRSHEDRERKAKQMRSKRFIPNF